MHAVIDLAIGTKTSIAAFVLVRHEFAHLGAGGVSSFGAIAMILLLVGAAAGLTPAARAASLNPAQALRRE